MREIHFSMTKYTGGINLYYQNIKGMVGQIRIGLDRYEMQKWLGSSLQEAKSAFFTIMIELRYFL